MTTVPIIIIITIVLTAILCWILFQVISKAKLVILTNKITEHLNIIEQLTTEQRQLQQQKDALLERALVAENEKKHLDTKLQNQKADLNDMSEKFKFEFKNLAQYILDEKAQKFTEVNQQKMNEILSPFKTQLGEFKQKVEDTYDKESKERFTLGKEVERLINMTQQVSQEANNLTSALKGGNKLQGNWGEMILESILESSGMAKNREYYLQEYLRDNAGDIIKDEHGKGLQPDAMIIYPDQRKVIIDSKVSLIAWDDCCAQADANIQKRFLHEHIKSIRKHIDDLQKKNYPRYALALDYVLMFIPIEPAFIEALKGDHSIWKYAYDKNILLVSPTNLFAVLRIVADLWKVEKQSRHAIEIADKAGSLYDKFAGFIENFELVGKRIADANSAYDNAHKQLISGRGNVTARIEELKKMGANAGKQLPDRILLTIKE